MPEQTFRSPNFFDREIDQSAPAEQGPVGVPAGVIGTSNRGPAFVPVTVGNFDQFISIFGNLDPKRFGPYAANAFLANRSSLTFLRMLGAGANSTSADILRTQGSGRVVSASFKLDGNPNVDGAGDGRFTGCVQFLTARHTVQANEAYGTPMFTDNNSISASGIANLVRGVVLLASGARMMVANGTRELTGSTINVWATLQLLTVVTLSSSFRLHWDMDRRTMLTMVLTACTFLLRPWIQATSIILQRF